MAISPPTIGTSVEGSTAATTVTLDFTAAADGNRLFAAIGLADSQASAPSAPAGWTLVQGSEGTSGAASSRTMLLHKTKSGDTTQAFTWPTSCKYEAIPFWYAGVGDVEGAIYKAHTSTANYVTDTVTPTGTGRWILGIFNARSTTAARTFSPDAAMTERADKVHGGANPWPTCEIADTNGAVTQTGHTYTSVCSGSESHGGAIAIALIPAQIAVTTGQATETDVATAFAVVKSRATSQATETDTAQPVTSAKTRQIGQVSQADAAAAVTRKKTQPGGQAGETDFAQPVGRVKAGPVGQAGDTNVAQPVGSVKTRSVAQAVEVDTATGVTVVKTRTVTPATETDLAQPLTARKLRLLGQLGETDTAQGITQPRFTRQATETNLAQPVTPVATGAVSPLYKAVSILLSCIQAQLATTAAGTPDRVCVVPGQIAWDDCQCGMLAATVTRVYPSRRFPLDISSEPIQVVCTPPYLAANVTVTVLRCAPGPDRNGNPPTCTQLAEAAATWRADSAAVLTAVSCCLPDLQDSGQIEEYVVRDLIPLGPEGGCVGLEQHLTLGLCAAWACA